MEKYVEFEINIEILVEILKTRKDLIKVFLIKHFRENNDYICTFSNKNKKGSGGTNKQDIYINKDTFEMIKNTYNLRHNKNFNIGNTEVKYINRIMNLEASTVGFIYDCYKDNTECVRQYRVLNYSIDLYLVEYKIAIECDEWGHDDRDSIYEKKREDEIKTKLGCIFIRFNPNDKDFKLSFVFSEILNYTLK